jgi:hypothetical protein
MPLLPDHPDLPALNDLHETQDWLDVVNDSAQNELENANHSTQDMNSSSLDKTSTKKKRTSISFMNKCIQAQVAFFLIDDHDKLHQTIAGDTFLNRLITSVPRKGQSNEYKILYTVICHEEVDHI